MRARLRKLIIPLIGINLIAAGVGFERSFNGPTPRDSGPRPLIVMDDWRELEVGLIVLRSYGANRYGGAFTEIGVEGHTLCTVPFSGYTVLLFMVGSVMSAVSIGRRYLRDERRFG